MNHSLELTGLREDNPRDFLAALGLLRMLDVVFTTSVSSVSWERSRGIPILSTTCVLPEDFAIRIWQRACQFIAASIPTLEPTRVMSVTSSDLRAKLEALVTTETQLDIAVLLSISSQLDVDALSRRSEFIIESGRIIPLKGIYESLGNVSYQPTLKAALLGLAEPFTLKHTPRWNPAEFRSAAYTTTNPADTDFLDHPTLNVLALIGLTFFPTVDTTRGAATTGFSRAMGEKCFSWPIWDTPLTSAEIGSMLHHPEVHAIEPDHMLLSAIGIHRVWRTRKFGDANNKYFSTAMPV